jgi:transcriptional regulator with XRE-family HTH domain
MPEDLWAIRRRKKMNVKELAARSGIAATSIHEYESGKVPIRNSDLAKLARALFVDPGEIKRVCSPKPRDTSAPAGPPRQPPAGPRREPRPPKPPREPQPPRPPVMVRPSQITYLVAMVKANLQMDQSALEAEAGKPLDQLTRKEASTLIVKYQAIIRDQKATRHRSRLPEGVDGFEADYLRKQKEASALLDFTLFDNAQIRGRVAGFGPYTITLQQENGDEVTLNKLAIAYYRKGEA